MIVEPERYIDAFAEAGADHLLVQAEPSSTIHLHRLPSRVRETGKKAEADADAIVAGSAIFGSRDYAAAITRIRSGISQKAVA
jgi:pentose-5-phosphate-3-epimerase